MPLRVVVTYNYIYIYIYSRKYKNTEFKWGEPEGVQILDLCWPGGRQSAEGQCTHRVAVPSFPPILPPRPTTTAYRYYHELLILRDCLAICPTTLPFITIPPLFFPSIFDRRSELIPFFNPKMETPIFSGYKGTYSSHPRDSPEDHGFQPSWASVPQVAFESTPYTTRDQVLRTPKRPIWEEAEERLNREAAVKRVALEQKLNIQATELDRSHYLALSSVAAVWNVVSGIAVAFGTGLGYAGKAVRAVNTSVGKAKGYMDSRRIRESYNPMGRRNRKKGRAQNAGGNSDSETESEIGNGTQSMLSMPPHMVGATP